MDRKTYKYAHYSMVNRMIYRYVVVTGAVDSLSCQCQNNEMNIASAAAVTPADRC